MMQQDTEYQEFFMKYIKLSKELLDEFEKLSPENKKRFQKYVVGNVGVGFTSFLNFINAKY